MVWIFVGAKTLAPLSARVTFSRNASLSDLLSDLKAERVESIAPLQEQKPNATAGVALQWPDLDAIYVICLIG